MKKRRLITIAIGCELFAALFLFVGDTSWRAWIVVPLGAIGGFALLMAFPRKLPEVMGVDPMENSHLAPAPAMAAIGPSEAHADKEAVDPSEMTLPLQPVVANPTPEEIAQEVIRLAHATLLQKQTPRAPTRQPYRERAHIMGLIAGWTKWLLLLLGSLVGAGVIATYQHLLAGIAIGLAALLGIGIIYSTGKTNKVLKSFAVKATIFLGVVALMSTSGIVFVVILSLILVVVISRMGWIWIKWYYTKIVADSNGFSVDFNTPAYIPVSDRKVRARRRSITVTEYDTPWWAEMLRINFVHLGQDTAAQKFDDILHHLRYLKYPEKLMHYIDEK